MATTRTTLKLLGGFDLSCAGRPVALQWSAQRLLVFVALHEQPLLRPYVAGSLWLESSEERANANLRSALWRLHRCGHALMECAGQRLALGSDVVVDLRESEKVAQRVLAGSSDDDLDVEPVALHGDLLPGWYDDWIIFERERYRQLRLRALDRLCERLTAADRLDEALEAGLAAVKLEPLRESSHRAVVRAHLADGNVAEAVRQYRICRRVLHDHLGLEPSEQMNSLLEGVHALATAR
ncbi:MAG TPA: BTAD domain-containing putative transcriptional regulator [Gaiellaceae bacterium]|jgi:DNA-binding SARP family transcriptional activator